MIWKHFSKDNKRQICLYACPHVMVFPFRSTTFHSSVNISFRLFWLDFFLNLTYIPSLIILVSDSFHLINTIPVTNRVNFPLFLLLCWPPPTPLECSTTNIKKTSRLQFFWGEIYQKIKKTKQKESDCPFVCVLVQLPV